jgi:putative oxidoreductase
MSSSLLTIGRILLGLFFVVSAALKIYGGVSGGFGGLAGYIGSRGIPQPLYVAYAVIAFELVAGLALIFGFLTTVFGLLLAGFCIATAVMFHNFWTFPPDQMQNQINAFLKNVGLAGGFLMIAGSGQRRS